MKAMRIVLYVLGGVVVLAIVGAIAVAMLFDANALKGEIERTVQEKTGRTLKLEGDIDVAFWPSIGASLGRASLSERDGKGTFVGLESAHVSVAVMPLLSRQIVVSGVRLEGLRATVARDKAGRFNFDDLLAAPAAAAKQKSGTPPPGDAGAVRFDIGGVRIERSAISYRDARSGQAIEVSDLDLRTGRIADDAPGNFEASAQVKSSAPPVDARVALSGEYRFNLAKKSFALSDLDAKVEGSAAGVTGLLLTLKGDVAADPAAQTYAVSGLALDAKGTRAQDAFEAKVTAPKLAIAPDKASGAAVEASFALKSPQRSADGKLKLSGVEGSAKVLKIASLAAQLNLSDPALPMKTLSVPLNGSLQANLEKETLQADVTSKFDETNLKAKLGLARFTPPSYTFDVDADRLNLDRYLGKPAAGTGAPGGGGGGGGGASDPKVDLSGLKGIEAQGRVHVGALQVENAKLSDVTARIRLANGRLEVTPHTAKLYEGALSGALSADADGNRVTLKQTLSNVSVGPLLRDVTRKDALEGRGNVALDLRTAGATVGAMKKSLAGTARIQLRDGAVKGIDLAETLRKAKAVLGSKSAREQLAEGSKQTDFSELSGSFNVINGVARNNDLQGKAPLFRLAGAGDIDIGNSRIDYLAKPTVVATSQGQGGRELAELNGVTVPVRLVGPFDAVKYQVDYAAVASALAKSRITESITGRKPGGTSGSPLDTLKGLFGK
ncbi:MAG: AsmA family protein [Burkholderiales bacterium]|nr:AsmA family protein [Burkholderiales bacterium]